MGLRRIIFRGKDAVNGEWYYGDLVRSRINGQCFIHTYNADGIYIRAFEVVPETVGQYTGLKDDKGSAIYEGDIIDIYDSEYETHDKNEVAFKNGVFGVANWTGNLTTLFFFMRNSGDSEYSVEVVGNVYDNKELLEDKEL